MLAWAALYSGNRACDDCDVAPAFTDALRGYAFAVHQRDRFTCVYCGLDGTVWPNWLYLSLDHLLPPDHPQRADPDYQVTACRFCNEARNRTLYDVEGKSPAEIVALKREQIALARAAYESFWQEKVALAEVAQTEASRHSGRT